MYIFDKRSKSLILTFSSIWCIVSPTDPNSTTGQIFEIKRASEVPPDVLNSTFSFVISKIDFSRWVFKISDWLRNDSPEIFVLN